MQMKYDGKKSETKKSSFVLVRKYQIVKRIECKINVGTIRAIKNSSHCQTAIIINHHHFSQFTAKNGQIIKLLCE